MPDVGPTRPRRLQSHLYDGPMYGRLIEPLLAGVHGFVAKQVPADSRVLDAGCGTGALARRLAKAGGEVVGVDLSPRNLDYAKAQLARAPLPNLTFHAGDVAHLDRWDDGAFDVATIVVALHEMPAKNRVSVLRELARVARRVFVLDYYWPMPWNRAGLRNRAIEFAAGPPHFLAFRSFLAAGGLDPLVARAGLTRRVERRLDQGTMVFQELHG